MAAQLVSVAESENTGISPEQMGMLSAASSSYLHPAKLVVCGSKMVNITVMLSATSWPETKSGPCHSWVDNLTFMT